MPTSGINQAQAPYHPGGDLVMPDPLHKEFLKRLGVTEDEWQRFIDYQDNYFNDSSGGHGFIITRFLLPMNGGKCTERWIALASIHRHYRAA
jgi:hypothetical protein